MKVNEHRMVAEHRRRTSRRAISLLEILIVVAVAAVLVGIVVPTLGRSRLHAKVTRAHADLRQIGVALEAYMMDYRDKTPPTRCGCSSNVQYQLPVELAVCKYLPRTPGLVPQADFPDVFSPSQGYKYRAPGPIWVNGTYFDSPVNPSKPRASIWVPDDFPACSSADGRYFHDRRGEPKSPVAYAIWSMGANPQSSKFSRSEIDEAIDESRFPLPREYWFSGSSDKDGLITHFRGRDSVMHSSPWGLS